MEEDVPVGNELALRKRMYDILENLTKVKLKEPEEQSGGPCDQTLHITTHLYTSLKKCLQQGNYMTSIKIMKYLVENGQSSRQFIWKMFITYCQKDIAFFLPLLPELNRIFAKLGGVNYNEICLVSTISLLNQELYNKAHHESYKFEVKGIPSGSNDDATTTIQGADVATSILLASYKTILEYQVVQHIDDQDQKDAFTIMMHSLQQLMSKNAFLPVLAETYIFILMKLDLKQEVEEFIYKYVESESEGNMGISAALHALNIVKLHLPKASQNLTTHLLEMIAVRNPGHPKVIELCRQNLYLHNTRMRSNSDTESNFDFESDEGSNTLRANRNRDSLNKCLELLFYFLDTHVNHEPDAIIREGWSIMSDTMIRVCKQGTDDCFQTIVKLYHLDRKRWWPCFRYQLPASLAPGDGEYFSHQGVVCYLLESESHSFVAGIMKMTQCGLLKSLVQQLRHSKIKFDSHIQSILSANERVALIPLKSLAARPHQTIIPTIETLETPCLSKFQAIDTEMLAKEFTEFFTNSRPVKGKEHYKSSAIVRSSTAELNSLSIDERLAQRYKKRRNVIPRSSSRMSNSTVNSWMTDSTLNSDLDDDSMTSQPLEDDSKPLTKWTHRLRSSGYSQLDSSDSLPANVSPISMLPIAEETDTMREVMERWKTFLHTGEWKALAEDDLVKKKYEDLSSSDEYVPHVNANSDNDNDSENESYSMRSELNSTLADEPTIRAGYPVSIASSYPSLSPASSISSTRSLFTPRLPVTSLVSYPREVIRNEDPYPFFEFDRMSVCSSNAEEVAQGVTLALENLNKDAIVDSTKSGTEVVPSVNIEEEETLVSSTRVEQTNVIPESFLPGNNASLLDPSRFEPGTDDEYVVEADIELPDETDVSSTYCPSRSFSRDFEASSPDMFVPLSEDEDAVKCVAETQQHKIEGHAVMAESSATKQPEVTANLSQKETPSINISPPTTSTTVDISIQENLNPDSKAPLSNHESVMSLNVSANKSKSKASRNKTLSNKKKNQRPSTEHTQWNIEMIDRIMEESLTKKSSNLKEKSFQSPNIAPTSPKNENPIHEEPVAFPGPSEKTLLSPKPPTLEKPVLVDSGKAAKNNSQIKRTSSQMVKSPRKGHVRVKDPRYWSGDEDENSDTGNPNETVKCQPKNKEGCTTSARRKLVDTQPNEEVSSASADKKTISSKSLKGKSLKSRVDTPHVSASLPDSGSETESVDQLIKKILAESRVTVMKKNGKSEKKKVTNKPEKKTQPKTSRRSTSSLKDKPVVEEPVNVSNKVEQLLKKYLGSDSSDEDEPPKKIAKSDSLSSITETKSAKPVVSCRSEGNPTNKVLEKVVKRKMTPSINEKNLVLGDRLSSGNVMKKTSVASKTEKKKTSSRTSRSSTSTLKDGPVVEEPVNVSNTVEQLLKKYLGSDSSDDDAPPKKVTKKKLKSESLSAITETKSAKPVASRHSEGNSKNKEKLVKKKKTSSIDDKNLALIDRLLGEKGSPPTPPTVKKPTKRQSDEIEKKKSAKQRKIL